MFSLWRCVADSRSKEESKELPSLEYKLVLLEREVFKGTDILTLKLSKQVQGEDKRTLKYLPGQFAFFDIGTVYNDPRGPIRYFSLASSPTEELSSSVRGLETVHN